MLSLDFGGFIATAFLLGTIAAAITSAKPKPNKESVKIQSGCASVESIAVKSTTAPAEASGSRFQFLSRSAGASSAMLPARDLTNHSASHAPKSHSGIRAK